MRDPFLQDLWRKMCGLPELHHPGLHPNLLKLKQNQWDYHFENEMKFFYDYFTFNKSEPWSEDFIKFMRNRLVMGSFRYGLMEEQDYSRFDLAGYIQNKIDKFNSSRDLECLIDACNNALLAFVHGCRYNTYKKPIVNNDFLLWDFFNFCVKRIKETELPDYAPCLGAILMYLYNVHKREGCEMKLTDDKDHAKEIIK